MIHIFIIVYAICDAGIEDAVLAKDAIEDRDDQDDPEKKDGCPFEKKGSASAHIKSSHSS